MHRPAHQHADRKEPRRVALALGLAAVYMVAEALGGWWTGSLALLADAGHMVSDVFALSLTLVAFRLARRPATPQQTFGHHRTEILAALAHGLLLVAVALFVLSEAVERLGNPRDILGGPMLAIASGGLLVNLIALGVLGGGRHDNLNVRGAWLHVLSDAVGSVGAITAALLVWIFDWAWADAVASIGIGVLVIYSAWSLLREAVAVLMEWAPTHVDVQAVERAIASLSGVAAVHDLHVWTISSGRVALSGHVVCLDGDDQAKLLQEVTDLLNERFGVGHSTIQIETEAFDEPGGVCFT